MEEFGPPVLPRFAGRHPTWFRERGTLRMCVNHLGYLQSFVLVFSWDPRCRRGGSRPGADMPQTAYRVQTIVVGELSAEE